MPFSSTIRTFSFAESTGRAIDDVVIVSFRSSMIPELRTTESIFARSAGEKSLVELTSKSAVIKARASVPTARVTFCISDRRATTDPTPRAMHKKKNNSRRQDERISRRVKLKINLIQYFHHRDTEAQRKFTEN